MIACEVFENGICSLLSRLVPDGAEATAPVPGQPAHLAGRRPRTAAAPPRGVLDKLFLMFPDPWPKARHAKRRFVHPEQVELVARVLKPGAEWRIASDDPTYQAWVDTVIGAQRWFTGPAPASERPDTWPPTRYEAKARRAGRQPRYWSLLRS